MHNNIGEPQKRETVGKLILKSLFLLLLDFLVLLTTAGFISIGHKIDIDYMRLFYLALLFTLTTAALSVHSLDFDKKFSWISLCLFSAGIGVLIYLLHSNTELMVWVNIALFLNLLFFSISTKKNPSPNIFITREIITAIITRKIITAILSVVLALANLYALSSLIFPTVSFGTVFGYNLLAALSFCCAIAVLGIIVFAICCVISSSIHAARRRLQQSPNPQADDCPPQQVSSKFPGPGHRLDEPTESLLGSEPGTEPLLEKGI